MTSAGRDFVALLKPGITGMALFAAAGTLLLAPRAGEGTPSGAGMPGIAGATMAAALIGIGAIVGAANALNQYVERDTDRLMERTRLRPLPDRRMRPMTGLAVGLVLAVASLTLLLFAVNALTAGLGLLALVIYVLIYTPMKRMTTAALAVGAVPGAMPVLMGWTSATGRIDPAGFALFLVMFVWQIPHFIAISVYRQDEYDAAGLHVVPTARGLEAARRETLAYSLALLPLSLAPLLLGVGGWAYCAAAVIAGLWLVALSLRRVETDADREREGAGAVPPARGACTDWSAWARAYFRATLVYIPALGAGLLIDSLVLAPAFTSTLRSTLTSALTLGSG